MRIPLPAYAAGTAFALALSVAPVAKSALYYQTLAMPGANCQLSIPTTDTKFRPKATGARNESTTTGSFVICPFSIPTPDTFDPVILLYASLYSLDGNAHDNVSCTAAVGVPTLTIPFHYSTKTFDVPASGFSQPIWQGSDLGGADGTPIGGSSSLSVTCLLPPQTAIDILVANYNLEI